MKIEVGIDWLTGSFPADNLLKVQQCCFEFGIDFREAGHGLFGYAESLRSDMGSFLTWSRGSMGGFARPEACISLNGSQLSGFEPSEILELLGRLFQLGFDASRIDLRLDDFDKIITPAALAEVVSAGDFVGFRVSKFIKSTSKRGVGCSIELGRRGSAGSGKMLVCYDKFVESGGKIDSVRWEARFYGDRAKTVVDAIFKHGLADYSRAIGGFVLGTVDFRVGAGSQRHVERCDRYSWWQALRDAIGGAVSVTRAVVARGLDAVLNWFRSSIAPRFALLLEAAERGAFGGVGVNYLIEDLRSEGVCRFDDFAHRLLAGVVRELPF